VSAVDPQIITPEWPAPPGVRAAFTLRTGGVSAAPYDSLNIGARIGDSPEAVAENRRRVREKLRLPAEPVWLEQVHGVEVVDLGTAVAPGGTEALGRSAAEATACDTGALGRAAAEGAARDTGAPGRSAAERDVRVARREGGAGVAGAAGDPARGRGDSRDWPPVGDASVARGAGQVCAIRVADCMPVLFAGRDGSVVGAAHAGWRGLAGGVLEATVGRLGLPATELIAWMGPAIGPEHFEVGEDVRAAFTASGAASAFVANARGRWQCDLYALARWRLSSLGIAGIYGGGWCTFAEAGRFFSYRRDGQCGRMAALIWIEAP
jgi:YfiH family protein